MTDPDPLVRGMDPRIRIHTKCNGSGTLVMIRAVVRALIRIYAFQRTAFVPARPRFLMTCNWEKTCNCSFINFFSSQNNTRPISLQPFTENSQLFIALCAWFWIQNDFVRSSSWPKIGLGLVSGYGYGTIIPDPTWLFMGNSFPSPDPNPRGRFATLNIKIGL